LFKEGHGGLPACSTCHTLDDSRLIGPGLRGIGSRASQHGPNEKDYSYNSIVQPGAYVVQGYDNVMPPNYVTSLSDQQIQDLIAYLLTLT
jgi:mono/diheme cytochrome c family protein